MSFWASVKDQELLITMSVFIPASYPTLVSSHDSSVYFLPHLTPHYVFLTQCFMSHCKGLLSNAWPPHTSAGTESLETVVGWKVNFECCSAKHLHSVTSWLPSLGSVLFQICRSSEIISAVSNTLAESRNLTCNVLKPKSRSDCCLVSRHWAWGYVHSAEMCCTNLNLFICFYDSDLIFTESVNSTNHNRSVFGPL